MNCNKNCGAERKELFACFTYNGSRLSLTDAMRAAIDAGSGGNPSPVLGGELEALAQIGAQIECIVGDLGRLLAATGALPHEIARYVCAPGDPRDLPVREDKLLQIIHGIAIGFLRVQDKLDMIGLEVARTASRKATPPAERKINPEQNAARVAAGAPTPPFTDPRIHRGNVDAAIAEVERKNKPEFYETRFIHDAMSFVVGREVGGKWIAEKHCAYPDLESAERRAAYLNGVDYRSPEEIGAKDRQC